MARFKVGDMVRIADRDVIKKYSDGVGYNNDMFEMSGEIHRIYRVADFMDREVGDIYYLVNSSWLWKEEMLIPVQPEIDVDEIMKFLI